MLIVVCATIRAAAAADAHEFWPEASVFVDLSRQTRQDVVRIHSSREKPPDAFAAVFYRGYWFWIDDGDWQTKRALTAVMFFFTLEGTGGAEKLPLVTIPAQ